MHIAIALQYMRSLTDKPHELGDTVLNCAAQHEVISFKSALWWPSHFCEKRVMLTQKSSHSREGTLKKGQPPISQPQGYFAACSAA